MFKDQDQTQTALLMDSRCLPSIFLFFLRANISPVHTELVALTPVNAPENQTNLIFDVTLRDAFGVNAI